MRGLLASVTPRLPSPHNWLPTAAAVATAVQRILSARSRWRDILRVPVDLGKYVARHAS